jgi:hypothetical protein
VVAKGSGMEELVRMYFALQGFFAVRGVSLSFEDEQVTDIDVWLYGRQSASVRTRVIVDVKDKRSPKAFERILWARGMQLALGCDRAIVATTDINPKVARFSQQQKVDLLSKQFLQKLEKRIDLSERLTAEQFDDVIRKYADQKQDGDWVKKVSDAKSAVISMHGYPAFNACMRALAHFAERAETRPQHKEQAIRCAYLAASLACIALDSALSQVVYEDSITRAEAIRRGVTYGDSGDARTQRSIETVLGVISEGMANGRVVAKQAGDAFERLFENVRAEIVAEYFSKEHNAALLFNVAKEFDERAHSPQFSKVTALSIEAKSVLGVFADFLQAKRTVLFASSEIASEKGSVTATAVEKSPQNAKVEDEPTSALSPETQRKLL